MSISSKDFSSLQGVGSKTFSLPQGFLDGAVTLPEIWDHHLEHSPNHPLFKYEDAPNDIKIVTWSKAVRAMHRAALIVEAFAQGNGQHIADPMKPPVIGIMAFADLMTSWALINGTIRAGYTIFLISPRNSAPAVAHLLKATGCTLLFTGNDETVKSVVQEAQLQMEGIEVSVRGVPHFAELYKEDDAPFEKLPTFKTDSIDRPALIAHSSGSTSFPKPITLTLKTFIQWSLLPYYGEIDICGRILSVHALPLFHILGVMSTIVWTSACGITVATFKPEDPPIISTPERVLAGALATKSSILLCVPSLVENWSLDPDDIASLKSFDAVIYSGGPLQRQVGDMMVERGVNIRTLYGATEFGPISVLSTKFAGKDWEYFSITSAYNVDLQPQDSDEGLYQLIVVDSPSLSPSIINTEVNGKPSYDSNDLLSRHPENQSLWKLYGRADDQIMHSTGEKTNPGPMEAIISRHPDVHGCVMFGRAQFQAGIIVEPIASLKFDPKDLESVAKFRNEIWPIVEEANGFAPRHSRIFKEMIIIADPARPLQYTGKGSLRRQISLNEYTADIEGAYKAVADSSRQDIAPPKSWELNDVTVFVRDVVEKILEHTIGDEHDIFQQGADSLQATSIRNTILRIFRDSNKPTTDLSQNLVYAHPTISSLSLFVAEVAAGGGQASAAPAVVAKDMQALVREFTQSFPSHTSSRPAPTTEAVLVTGTTGSLGSLILKELILTPSVTRVYALNRPDRERKKSARQRQARAFEEHSIDAAILDSPKLILLEGDTTSPDLGVSPDVYQEMLGSLTSIIHNAWRVDFNLSLTSFKPLLRGVRNLVDFALASPLPQPPSIVFTSSVATIQSLKQSEYVPEAVTEDPGVAVGTGYGESKWVAENILNVAHKTTPLNTVVIRVGQLSGSTTDGSWNPWEWFPAIVQSAKLVGCLPDHTGVVTWVPVDTAAATVVDMRSSSFPFLHLSHPRPVPFSTIITSIAKSLDVPVVPYAEWLAKLETVLEDTSATAVETARGNPALRLIDFYRVAGSADFGADGEAFIGMRLEVKEAVKASKTLGDPGLSMLGSADADLWLSYWRKIGAI